MKNSLRTVRISAVGDIHYTRKSQGALQPLFVHMTDSSDVILLCGDLTNTGLPEEAQILAKDLRTSAKVPVLAVLGNHDYENNKWPEIKEILFDAGVTVLDGESIEVHGIGFAGVKGFAGGFGGHALQPWGEEIIKRFVQESVNEALKLESALSMLGTSQRVALMHYSPVRETVSGEHPEIFTYLGSSRMEEPLNRCQVAAVFHSHAHHGNPEGRTKDNIPVYNVSMPMLQRAYPGQEPYRLLELGREHAEIETGPIRQ